MTEVLTRSIGKLSSFNAEARTVDVVLATETPVRRRSWQHGDFDEVLTVNKGAIDASRLDTMALLDSHDAVSGLDARLGSIVPGSLRFANGTAIVTAKLSRNPRGEALHRDLEDGHVMGVSVGYRIDSQERSEAAAGGVATVRATRWTPLEISVVSIPADPNASTRADSATTQDHPDMTTETQKITRAERARIADIRSLATGRVEDAEAFINEHIEAGTSIENFRAALLEKIVERQERTPTFPHQQMDTRHTSIRMADAMADALRARADSSHKPQADAREFVGLSLPELARRALDINGISTLGMSAGDVVQRALHTTSDFSHVISSVGQSILAEAYQAVPSGIKAVARESTAKDFKTKSIVRLSGFSDLEKVNEHGEYKRGTFSEGAESYRIATWGKIFGMTRQMIINDELGAFADVSRQLGQAAARLEADLLAGLVKSNPVMADGKAVFHADHKNLAASGGALNETTLSAARLAMGKQVGLAGELIDVVPAYLVVSLELQTTAEKLLAAIQPATTDDVNVFSGRLKLVVDRRLDAAAWYVVANPNLVPSLEYSYLEGNQGPRFDTRAGFDIDGVETKVSMDFGAGWVDHRGWYKNPGA